MEARGETTWVEQWDNTATNTDYVPAEEQNHKESTAAKYKKKVGDGMGKTKTVASHGFNKVKESSAVGFYKVKETALVSFQWMKAKYQKTTNKT